MGAKDIHFSKQRMKLVEEYAALDAHIDAVKPMLFRYEKLRLLILSWNPNAPADEEYTVPGDTCDIVVTARDQVRAVSLAGKTALFKRWGQRGFIKRAIVQLKMLPDPEDKRGAYSVKAPTGPRHLHVVPKSSKAAQSAA